MASHESGTVSRIEKMGFSLISPELGTAAIEGILKYRFFTHTACTSLFAGVPFVWERFKIPETSSSYFSEFTLDTGTSGRDRKRSYKKDTRNITYEFVLSEIAATVIAVLGKEVGKDDPLMAIGLDSLGSVELQNSLEKRFGIQLPGTLVFDYPSISAMGSYIAQKLSPTEPSTASKNDSISRAMINNEVRVGSCNVSSLVGRTPKHALRSIEGVDAPISVPSDRWDISEQASFSGSFPYQFAGFLDNIDKFDPHFFGIQLPEASHLDPQQRLLLECSMEALVGFNWAATSGPTGVFTGVSSMDYNKLTLRHSSTVSAYTTTGASLSVTSGRLSYTYGFKGPTMTIDTACSSSLVSLHTALNCIRLNECVQALNCGVNLALTADTPSAFQRAGMLAPDGRCKTLDTSADGYVRSEACVVMVLDQLKDVNQAVAIVRGTAVNQDGRSSSLTAPNGPSQQLALRNSFASAGVILTDVDQLQMHGTGTSLGDPIEIGAVHAVFEDGNLPLKIMASKSWMGHSEPAAGIAGIMHSHVAMASNTSLPILHLKALSNHILDILKTSQKPTWHLPRQTGPKPLIGTQSSITGTSGFAFQGTNSHVLLESGCLIPHELGGSRSHIWEKLRCWVTPKFSTSSGNFGITGSTLSVQLKMTKSSINALSALVRSENKLAIPMSFFLCMTRCSLDTLGIATKCNFIGLNSLTQNHTSAFHHVQDAPSQSLEFSWDVNCSKLLILSRTEPSRPALTLFSAYLSPLSLTENSKQERGIPPFSILHKDVIGLPSDYIWCSTSESTYAMIDSDTFKLESSMQAACVGCSTPSMVCTIISCAIQAGLEQDSYILGGRSALHTVSNTSSQVQLFDIGTRSVKELSNNMTTPKEIISESTNDFLYAVEWEICNVSIDTNFSSKHRMQLAQNPLGMSDQAIKDHVGLMSILQSALSIKATSIEGSFPSSCHSGCLPGDMCINPNTGGYSTMLRTLMHEQNSMSVLARSHSSYCQGQTPGWDTNHNTSPAVSNGGYNAHLTSGCTISPILKSVRSPRGAIGNDLRTEGVYVVTGGSGMIALHVSKWLMSLGVAHVHLVSRKGSFSPSLLYEQLSDTNSVTFLSSAKCDMSSVEDTRYALEGGIHFQGRQILGFIHCGGVLSDGTILNQSPQKFRSVWSPKLGGSQSWNQHLTLHAVEHEVLLSSVASLLGSPGQANYCSCNGALDEVSKRRQVSGRHCISVQYGAWAGTGMASNDRSTVIRMQRMGMQLIQPEEAIEYLNVSIALGKAFFWPVVSVGKFNWGELLKAKEVPEFFSEMPSPSKAEGSSPSDTASIIDTEDRGKLIPKRKTVLNRVRGIVKNILELSVMDEQPLMAAGIDSLGSVELKNSLEADFDLPLPSTFVFDFPTVNSITDQLVEILGGDAPKIPPRHQTTVKKHVSNVAVTVEEIACKSPGGVLCGTKEVDSVGLVPLERWDVEECHSLSMMARFLARLDSIDLFDPEPFGLLEAESTLMDPQQRLLLESTAEVLNALTNISEARGVYVGLASSDYGSIVKSSTSAGAFHATSNSISVASGRLSYTFNLRGPCMSIDTACSASLVGVDLARKSIQDGEIKQAIACGVHLQCTETSTDYVSRAGMLSKSGRCKTLDAGADGYVRGEGCIALGLCGNDNTTDITLKKHGIAILLHGSAINQDGRSSSLTAPNGPAQQEVVLQALHSCGLYPEGIGSVSMHGTGTSLGDPIEVGALARIVKMASSDRISPITLMASKTWVGHLEPAAGLAGLVHSAMSSSMQSGLGVIHLRTLNPYIATTLEEMSQKSGIRFGRTRCPQTILGQYAGTSSFAYMGTNAHVLTEALAKDLTSNVPSASLQFDRNHFWATVQCTKLRRFASNPGTKKICLHADLCKPNLSFLCDHKVQGRPLFPGAGFLEMVATSIWSIVKRGQYCESLMTNLSISTPLEINQQKNSTSLLVSCEIDLYTGDINISSLQNGRMSVHVTCSACRRKMGLCLQDASLKKDRPLVGHYPPIDPTAAASGSVVVDSASKDGWLLAPGMLDSSLQLGQVFLLQSTTGIYVPYALDAMKIDEGLGVILNWTTAIPKPLTGKYKESNYYIRGVEGKTSGLIAGMQARKIAKEQPKTKVQKDCLYSTSWQISEVGLGNLKISNPCSLQLKPLSAIRYCATGLSALQRSLAFSAEHFALMAPVVQDDSPGGSSQSGCDSAALQGILRCAAQEGYSSTWSVENLDSGNKGTTNTSVSLLPQSVKSTHDVFGCIHCGGCTLVPHLSLMPYQQSPSPLQFIPFPRGSLNTLVPTAPKPQGFPGNYLTIEVKAVGVNFRDILNVLGMYPGDPGAPGGDCSGLVVGASSEYHKSAPSVGDAVFGLAAGCLGTHVSANPKTMVTMPTNITFEEAATTPTVFVTANIALEKIGELTKDARVLVHGAAGGVGLAALQVILNAGGELIATAGSEFKRGLLRDVGVSKVFNSRDLRFVEHASAHGGVHIILNSLTSSGFVGGSLSLLKEGGIFIELSKRSVWSPLSVRLMRPDANYSFLAVDFMSDTAINRSMTELSYKIATGAVQPLRQIVHNLDCVKEALRQISQSRHVGKVVITNRLSSPQLLQDLKVVIVIGGTGALGRIVSEWFVYNQVPNVILIGRTGRVAERGCLPTHSCSTSKSTRIITFKCDPSFSEDAHILSSILPGSVDAIFHAGGVLADGLIGNQTLQNLRSVFAPKVKVMSEIERHLLKVPILQTVLFSSVASLMGSPGQANYGAANGALDKQTLSFVSSGLPITSMQFGPWAGNGMAMDTADKSAAMGIGMLSPEMGLATLSGALATRSSTIIPSKAIIAASPFDWETFFNKVSRPSQFLNEFESRGIEHGNEPRGQQQAVGYIGANLILRMKSAERREYLVREVEQATRRALGSDVSHNEPLMSAGLDSLGAVEFRNSLSTQLALDLPTTFVFDYPTIDSMVAYLEEELDPAVKDNSQVQDCTLEHRRNRYLLGAISAISQRSPADCIFRQYPCDVITPVPISRWNKDIQLTAGLPARFLGVSSAPYDFDCSLFGVSRSEGIMMDPQQRVLLECVYELTTHNKSNRDVPEHGKAGVFTGISTPDYSDLKKKHTSIGVYSATGMIESKCFRPHF